MPGLDQVLHLTARPLAVHEHRHAAAVTSVALRLSWTLRVDPARAASAPRATGAAPRGPGERGPVRGPAGGIDRTEMTMPARVVRVVPRAAHVETAAPIGGRARAVPAAPTPIDLAHRRTRGATASRRIVASVPLVHRAAPAAAAPSAVPASRPPVTPTAGLKWDGAGAVIPLPPLTSADIPQVVDRVVGEIDRRLTAARERRGWTA